MIAVADCSVADMVKRFQHESSRGPFEATLAAHIERPRSAGANKRNHRGPEHHESDSDIGLKAPPRLRRGRTEQPPTRQREISKPGLLSDGDRSYAANASRIPSAYGRRSLGVPDRHSRSRPVTVPSSPAQSRRTSPERQALAGPSRGADKPRIAGKGKATRSNDGSADRLPSGLLRTGARRTFGSSRVTSIARHFDRLSEEADRQRARRNAVVRSKRARPVSATKAKVQVFNNVRDAFRDESDSASSEADNEEDDVGSEDSAESYADGNAPAGPKVRRKSSSPVKHRKSVKEASPAKAAEMPASGSASLAVPVQPSTSMETVATSAEAGGIPISASGSSVNAPSILSEGRSELSFTDRLQIELPQFETCAPLPSVPATTQPSADTGVLTADESARNELGQVSQMSEGEMSSGGERSSILKTLTGLWAFRAGDYSPLEYPLSAAEHLFTDSRVIIRENEPTSIIAFTLSAKPYRDKMRNNRFQTSRKVETFMPEDTMPSDRASTWDIVSLDEAMDTDEPSKHEGGTHLKYGECERVVERGRLR